MKLTVIIHDDEDGLWAEVPALPGCFSQGDTREELMFNIREAAELWLEAKSEMKLEELEPDLKGENIQTAEIAL